MAVGGNVGDRESPAMRSNRHIRIGLLERLFPRLRTPLILLQWAESLTPGQDYT